MAGSPSRAAVAAVAVQLVVNGRSRTAAIDPRRTLLDLLRLDFGLTGAKSGCGQGNCGACTVLVDGRAVYACLTLAAACAGRSVTTIEGLGGPDGLDPLQQAFVDCDALQCGYCTPGQIMAARALLADNPHPSVAEVRIGMSGNLCRCGAYQRITEAVLRAGRDGEAGSGA